MNSDRERAKEWLDELSSNDLDRVLYIMNLILTKRDLYNKAYNLQQRINKAIEKLYCWGEALNPDFQKEMLSILKEEELENAE